MLGGRTRSCVRHEEKKVKKWMVAFMALSLILSNSSGCAPKEGATGPLPSEAQAKVRSALSEKRSNNELETYELYAAARKDMALLEIKTIRTTGLEREEQYKYAELLTWAEMKDEAVAEYGELATGSDLTAREASKQLFDLNIPEVKEDPEGYEKKVPAFSGGLLRSLQPGGCALSLL